ncbi:MAG: endonuclease III [Clostridia bacterium]|nr:endonuclease III [Clostridia bacterium]
MKKTEMNNAVCILNEKYKNAECELKFSSTFELLVAVILSAQCTDKRVNKVTEQLFKVASTPEQFVKLSQEELENLIKPCGFYHNKAKNIKKCSEDLVKRFCGVVPSDKKELKSLAGVGEKTANVVLSTAFKTPAIAVDTHVFRVSRRIGIASGKNVKEVQSCLEKNIDRKDWSASHYSLVLHGRYVCKARKPDCANCVVSGLCDYNKKQNKG